MPHHAFMLFLIVSLLLIPSGLFAGQFEELMKELPEKFTRANLLGRMSPRLPNPIVVLKSFSEEGSKRICSKQRSLKGRLIVYNEAVDFIGALYPDPRLDGTDTIEFIEFDYEQAKWDFHTVDLPSGDIETNPKSCQSCHSFHLRPITYEYNNWKIWLGMIHPQRAISLGEVQEISYDPYQQQILKVESTLVREQGPEVFKKPPYSEFPFFQDLDLNDPKKVVEIFQQNNTNFTAGVKKLQSYKIYRDVIAALAKQGDKLPFDQLYLYSLFAKDGGIPEMTLGFKNYDPIELENRVFPEFQDIINQESETAKDMQEDAFSCALRLLSQNLKEIKNYASVEIPLSEFMAPPGQGYRKPKNPTKPPFYWEAVSQPLSFMRLASRHSIFADEYFTGNMKNRNKCVWRSGLEPTNQFWTVGNYFLFHLLRGEQAPFEIPGDFGDLLPEGMDVATRNAYFEQYIGGKKRVKGAISDANTYEGFRKLVFASHPNAFY